MSRRAKWWIAGAVLGLTAIVAAGAVTVQRRNAQQEAERKGAKPPLEFTQADVVRLQRRRLSLEAELPGTLQAVSQATVRAKVAAEVKRVLVREGDRVNAGQTVAEFDTAQLRAQLAERNAAIASAQAELGTAERNRKANEQLLKQNFISQNAYDTTEGVYQTKLAALELARAQLEQTQIALTDAVVRSPISGLVSKRYVQPGEKVGFDAMLLAIVDLSQLEVQAQAPLADIAKIELGMLAKVEVEGLPERSFTGKVERINPSAEQGTRSINVYVSLKNEGSLLKTGMFARVRLTMAAERETAALPVSAVRGEGAQTYVWLIAGSRLERRAVSIGTRDDRAHLVEILSGVQASENVIATKFDNLQHGLPARLKRDGGAQTVEPATTSTPTPG
ncbi:MAG: efflux RND transporter periplasmic adaptor subunit [Betaproteobacteria bacterium]|nr:MAG: efflux RND transporter periplasmic adaptor subunit [Betaproteobacteria bacterium]